MGVPRRQQDRRHGRRIGVLRAAAFVDGAGKADALTVAAGTYKVFFLAFPVEAYGTAANRADLVARAFTWFGTP